MTNLVVHAHDIDLDPEMRPNPFWDPFGSRHRGVRYDHSKDGFPNCFGWHPPNQLAVQSVDIEPSSFRLPFASA